MRLTTWLLTAVLAARSGRGTCYLPRGADSITQCRDPEPTPPPKPLPVGTKPNLVLNDYHRGCDSALYSRSMNCIAAVHRYCMYTHPQTPIGIAQELTANEFWIVCAPAMWYADVAYRDIPACEANAVSDGCYADTHRHCESLGLGRTTVGVVQELGAGVAGVACVPVEDLRAVKMDVLVGYHEACRTTKVGQESGCYAAAHRYCGAKGFVGGIVAESMGSNWLAVGCVNGPTQGVKVLAK